MEGGKAPTHFMPDVDCVGAVAVGVAAGGEEQIQSLRKFPTLEQDDDDENSSIEPRVLP